MTKFSINVFLLFAVAINLIMRYTESLCKTRRQSSKSAQINGLRETNSDRDSLLDPAIDSTVDSIVDSAVDSTNDSMLDSVFDPLECAALDQNRRGTPSVSSNCNSADSKALQALLNNLCYQVAHCDDEKHSSKPNNDLIIIK